MLETQVGQLRIGGSCPSILRGDVLKLLDVAARENPVLPEGRESQSEVDLH